MRCRAKGCQAKRFEDADGNPYRYCRKHGAKVSRGEMGACCSTEDDGLFICELAGKHPGEHRDGGLTWSVM